VVVFISIDMMSTKLTTSMSASAMMPSMPPTTSCLRRAVGHRPRRRERAYRLARFDLMVPPVEMTTTLGLLEGVPFMSGGRARTAQAWEECRREGEEPVLHSSVLALRKTSKWTAWHAFLQAGLEMGMRTRVSGSCSGA
jgi:hypothetical protein